MKYNVTFTFGGCTTVDACSKEDAEQSVAEMDDDVLWDIMEGSFEVQLVEEVTE